MSSTSSKKIDPELANRPHKKIALFVYSPAMTFKPDEFQKRMSIFCNMEINQHFIHWEVNRGGDDSLLDLFQTFLQAIEKKSESELEKTERIVLLLTCHGIKSKKDEKKGDFRDEHLGTVQGKPCRQTAEGFATTVKSCYDKIGEIKNSRVSKLPFTVVCAQCYGDYFADRLRKIIVDKEKLNVSVDGLSYGKTHRDYVQGTRSTIGRIQVHREFYDWLRGSLGIASAPAPATDEVAKSEEESDDQDSDTNDDV